MSKEIQVGTPNARPVTWGELCIPVDGTLIDLAYLNCVFAHSNDPKWSASWMVASADDLSYSGDTFQPRAGARIIVNTSHAARVAVHVSECDDRLDLRICCMGVFHVIPPFGRYALASSAPDLDGLIRCVAAWAQTTYGAEAELIGKGDLRSRA